MGFADVIDIENVSIPQNRPKCTHDSMTSSHCHLIITMFTIPDRQSNYPSHLAAQSKFDNSSQNHGLLAGVSESYKGNSNTG